MNILSNCTNREPAPFQIGQPVWLNPDYDFDVSTSHAFIVSTVYKNSIGLWSVVCVREDDLSGQEYNIACRYLLADRPASVMLARDHPGNIYQTATGNWLRCIRNEFDR